MCGQSRFSFWWESIIDLFHYSYFAVILQYLLLTLDPRCNSSSREGTNRSQLVLVIVDLTLIYYHRTVLFLLVTSSKENYDIQRE